MKIKRGVASFLMFVLCASGLHAQQLNSNRNAFEKTKLEAEAGDAKAQFQLGFCYYNGDGIEKNVVEAVKWCRKAADQKLADAQYQLAVFYTLGDGVEKDFVEVFKWNRKAAEQGLAIAQCDLGVCYDKGLGIIDSCIIK